MIIYIEEYKCTLGGNMYSELFNFLKLLSDENRLKIIDMLSCKELSNKELLCYLNISQPTLSYHIKILEDGGLVTKRVEKNTHYYKLNIQSFENDMEQIKKIYEHKSTCTCFKEDKC